MGETLYVCEEHVDLALEAAAEETLSPPLFEKINAQDLSTPCVYCKGVAIYMVTNTYSHTEY